MEEQIQYLDYEGLLLYHRLIDAKKINKSEVDKKIPENYGSAGLVLTSSGSGNSPVWSNLATTTDVSNLPLPSGEFDPNNWQNYFSEKENKIAIVNVPTGTTSLTVESNKYYNILGTVNSFTITLPLIDSSNTVIKNFIMFFTTGLSPNITITSSDNATVSYFNGYSIDADTSYEINCLWNGIRWIISYGIIN